MSLFNPATAKCPNCGQEQEVSLVASVNADRRDDLRREILESEFQIQACSNCGARFRVLPQMTYLDVGRHQWILVQPAEAVAKWEDLEQAAQATFDLAFGAEAPTTAQEIGRELSPRVTFGWAALREKLLCAEHGLADIELELLKMAVMRDVAATALADDSELRLVAVEGDELVLAWLNSVSEAATSTLRVPRSVYEDIASDRVAWQPLRDGLTGVTYVDINRLLV